MKRKREKNEDEKIKKRKIALNEITAKKILFDKFLNPKEENRYHIYRETKFNKNDIDLLSKTNKFRNEESFYIAKTLKEYIGVLVSKTKELMSNKNEDSKTINVKFLKETIINQIANGDFLLNDIK